MSSTDMIARLRSFRKHWILRKATEIDDLTEEELRKFDAEMCRTESGGDYISKEADT